MTMSMAFLNQLLLSLLFLSLPPLLTFTVKEPTRLHFYMDGTTSFEPNTTVTTLMTGLIALPTTHHRTGDITVDNEPANMIKGPDFMSTVFIGGAQGLFTVMKSPEVNWAFNVVFTYGEYNGSTVAILGRDAVRQARREFMLVGGSGALRVMQGLLLIRTSAVNIASASAVLELQLYSVPFNSSQPSV